MAKSWLGRAVALLSLYVVSFSEESSKLCRRHDVSDPSCASHLDSLHGDLGREFFARLQDE
jgi:hypothetical protein